jgi:hypothetical protein
MRFSVQALSEDGISMLTTLTPSWLIRILSAGMNDSNVLHRLYEQELAGAPFTDAPGLIWHLEQMPQEVGQPTENRKKTFDLVSAKMWFEPLQKGQVFRAKPPVRL